MSVLKQQECYSKIVADAGHDQKTFFQVANELLDQNKGRVLVTSRKYFLPTKSKDLVTISRLKV